MAITVACRLKLAWLALTNRYPAELDLVLPISSSRPARTWEIGRRYYFQSEGSEPRPDRSSQHQAIKRHQLATIP